MRLPGLHDAPHERDVFLFDLAIVELPRQLDVRAVVLRHHHQARRSAIEAMHDARPQLAADAAEIVHLVEQRVDERALRVPGGGMHHHARRLVHDDEVRVLIDDVEVDGLRAAALGSTGSGMSTAIVSPARTTRFGRHRLAGDGDLAVLDQPLNLRARLAGQHARRDTDRCGRPPRRADTSEVCRETRASGRAPGRLSPARARAGAAGRTSIDEAERRENRPR